MKILAIETSCDETAISIIDARGTAKKPSFSILADRVASQIELHRQFGGVFPAMAKREHSRAIVPLFTDALKTAKLAKAAKKSILTPAKQKKLATLLEREPEMFEQLLSYIPTIQKPKIDLIAVTSGPGLEPALWVGINFAKALAIIWDIPVIPVNHMEGHVVSSILATQQKATSKQQVQPVAFPAISLLISGGHTEIILVKNWMQYKMLGETQDDAAGEAFDKVARMLGLPYPGGPEISRLAQDGKENESIKLPRPMLHTPDYNFSFSGLKTAVLYLIQKIGTLSKQTKKDIALEFETAVADVLVKKTMKAIIAHRAKTLLLGGGVANNRRIRAALEKKAVKDFPKLKLCFPRKDLSTDNALMIGIAGYFRFQKTKRGKTLASIKADGGMRIA